jgi:hypothetical protein
MANEVSTPRLLRKESRVGNQSGTLFLLFFPFQIHFFFLCTTGSSIIIKPIPRFIAMQGGITYDFTWSSDIIIAPLVVNISQG